MDLTVFSKVMAGLLPGQTKLVSARAFSDVRRPLKKAGFKPFEGFSIILLS